jgi:DNA primase
MSVFDEIRNQLDIVDVISDYISLKRVGNSYSARCPFHADRTPSFYVSPSKQIWKCFGCGKGGDVIKFVAEYENISYYEAAKLLAERYNLNVEFKEEQTTEGKYYSALNKIGNFYYENLPRVKEARDYLLKERKLSPYLIKEFNIGFTGEGFESVKFAKSEGIFENLLELKHFFRTAEGRYKDFFYNRVVIPIKNELGKVVAYGGRVLGKGEPKYKNSPNSVIFQKEKALFGIDKARTYARDKKRIILVEGYFDVIRLHSVGLGETVAPLGTALTFHQARLISRYTDTVVLLFDGDSAGRKAAIEAAKNLFKFSLNVFVSFLPQGEDPDTFVLNYGVKEIRKFLSEAKPIQVFLIEKIKDADLQRKELLAKLYKELVENIADPIKRELWIKEFRNKTGLILTKKKTFISVKTAFPPEGWDKTEAEFLLGLLYLKPENIDLSEFNLSQKAKELAQKILKGEEKENLPRWLFEADLTDLEKRFELAKFKLSTERYLNMETYKALYQLEEKIKFGKATIEEIKKYRILLAEVGKINYERFKKTYLKK